MPKSKPKKRRFQIHMGEYAFVAEVTNDKRNRSIIEIGGVDKKCITMEVVDGHTANVIGLVYNERCCMSDAGLPASKGTISLVHAGIFFLADQFPNIQTVHYDESSYFKCRYTQPSGRIAAHNIHLAAHNMLVYGSTWYERIVGSQFAKPKLAAQHKVARARQVSQFDISGKSFAALQAYVDARNTSRNSPSDLWMIAHQKKIDMMFTKAKTLGEFARMVQSMDQGCHFFHLYMNAMFDFAHSSVHDVVGTAWVFQDLHACAASLRGLYKKFSIRQVSIDDALLAEAFANMAKNTRGPRRAVKISENGYIGDWDAPGFRKYNL